MGFHLSTVDGVIVFVAGDNEDAAWTGKTRPSGVYRSVCKVPALLLNSGPYTLNVASDLRNTELLFLTESVLGIDVDQTILPAHSKAKPAGVISPLLEWEVRRA